MWIFLAAMLIALANLPLLWIQPGRREQRLWRGASCAATIHPWLTNGELRQLRYVLLLACVAYLLGSIIQRQKIVIASNERTGPSKK